MTPNIYLTSPPTVAQQTRRDNEEEKETTGVQEEKMKYCEKENETHSCCFESPCAGLNMRGEDEIRSVEWISSGSFHHLNIQ